ncbi:MAG: threonylcarbamoyl-AMP synthase [Acidobacteriia bacterium]|nr:threonylcarbamoyl-AMP synthase [Terriglobia bacterium]
MLRLPFTSEAHLPAAAEAVRAALARHGIVALPTEASYGLAVDPEDDEAVRRLVALKGRPSDKAFLVVGASLGQLERLIVVPPSWRGRLQTAWPAPFTVVLPASGAPLAVGAGHSLAVRVPAHELLRALLGLVGPLTATSANPSGDSPLVTPDAVAETLGHSLALLLDGGDAPGGVPSTLLDLMSSPPRVLRRGAWEPPAAWGVTP